MSVALTDLKELIQIIEDMLLDYGVSERTARMATTALVEELQEAGEVEGYE